MSLLDQYGAVDVFESKAYIERALGIAIDPKDRSNRLPLGSEDYPLKSYEALLAEKDKLIRQVNRDEQIGIIISLSSDFNENYLSNKFFQEIMEE